jgi:hypothetical protein
MLLGHMGQPIQKPDRYTRLHERLVMQSFVTTTSRIVRPAHIWRPLSTPLGPIWYVDVSFPDGWPGVACNGPLAGLWRFVAASAPSLYDGKGKATILTGELGRGSIIKVAGNQLAGGRRTVLTMKAVLIVDLVEPANVFSQEFV